MLRVATWNVNSIGMRVERLVAFLARVQPDALCLQELKCMDEKFPWEQVRAAGYHVAAYGQKTYNGVAILSKEEPLEVTRGFGDGVDDPQARFITARFRSGLTVGSLYVPNGQAVGTDKYFYKLNWLARFRRWLDREHVPQDQLLMAGDFNVAPTDADVHDPAAWRETVLCSTRERQALLEVQAFGLVDAFRQVHPQETQFTWWDYRMLAFPKNHGLRIDLMLATPSVAARLTECHVERDERKGEKPSDHAPVVCDLRD